ncbi:MAG: alkaline phosphatase [Planctomycetota bacterium]
MPWREFTIGRRGILGLGAAGFAAGALPTAAAAAASTNRRSVKGKRRAKNVVFLVSDGMSSGTFTLAEMMRDVKGMGPSHWSRLWSKPGVRRASCTTYSASGWVTDSAAAGSAWGIGEHIENGAINFTPDGRTPEPILVSAHGMGKRSGLVTTTRLTHATPAAFVANAPRRSLEADIARQMLDRGVDVMLGGGRKHFGSLIANAGDLTVVETREAMLAEAAATGRLLGLFHHDHVPYALDRGDEHPSLADMTRVALGRLENAPDGFVLQVEGGRVDHGAHANDAAGMIADQIDFDEAVGVVAEWADERDDTLVIVTTDHANANPGLGYYGKPGVESFERLAGATRSFEWIFKEGRTGGAFDAFVDSVQAGTGVELTGDEIATLRTRFVDDQPVNAFDIANGKEPVLGSVLANHFGVAFMCPNHTSDLVEVTAFGPGSEAMPMLIDNTDLYRMAMAAMSDAHASPWAG